MSPRHAAAVSEPGDDPAAALRAHLIAVTGRLLATEGLSGLTTRRIAREAQVADGVLYNHFTNKDALILAALQARLVARTEEFLQEVPDHDTPLGDGLQSLTTACVGLLADVLPLGASLLGRPDLLERFFRAVHTDNAAGPHQILEALAGYLRGQPEAAAADPAVDPNLVATVLLGAAGLEALARHLNPAAVDEGEAHAIAAFVERGLSLR